MKLNKKEITDLGDFVIEANHTVLHELHKIECMNHGGNLKTKRYEGLKFASNWFIFGNNPRAVTQVVYYNNQPIWSMSLRSSIDISDTNLKRKDVLQILKYALSEPYKELPIRGPIGRVWNGLSYGFAHNGTIVSFTAHEVIKCAMRKTIYSADIIGGLIDSSSV